MLFIIILRINTFLLKINTKPVKSSEKILSYNDILLHPGIIVNPFHKSFSFRHKTDTNVYLQKIAKAKLPQSASNILRKFGFIYFSDILLLEQGG